MVRESNLNVSVAWRLREDFKAIFECSSFTEAKAYFNLWLDEVNEAGVKEVMKIADMFKNHFDGVCNALWNRQSNAKAERINGKIQEVKTMVEDTEPLKISELLLSSSAAVWISIHTIRFYSITPFLLHTRQMSFLKISSGTNVLFLLYHCCLTLFIQLNVNSEFPFVCFCDFI